MRSVKHIRFIVMISVFIQIFSGFCHSEEVKQPGTTLARQVHRLYLEDKPGRLDKIIKKILDLNLTPKELMEALRSGINYASLGKVKKGWQEGTYKVKGGDRQDYISYIPEWYSPQKKIPLLIYLRGAISSVYSLKNFRKWTISLQPHIDKLGCLMVLPNDNSRKLWWSSNGLNTIKAILGKMKKIYNIDENKVFVMGFSDGSSGTQWLAAVNPTPFAGFFGFSGDITVTRTSPYQVYPENLGIRPIRIVNGEDDPLYPARGIKKIVISKLTAWKIPHEWQRYQKVGHRFDYFKDEVPVLKNRIQRINRDPFPGKVSWFSSNTRVGRCNWLRIDQIRPVKDTDAVKNLDFLPYRYHMGLTTDQNYQGEGVRITAVKKGEMSDLLGLLPEDILIRLDGDPIRNIDDLTAFTGKKSYNEPVSIRINRNGLVRELKGTPRYNIRPVFPRRFPTAVIQAVRTENIFTVYTTNVAGFTILISPEMVDLKQPVEVKVNGKNVYRDLVKPDFRMMLDQVAGDKDRSMVYLCQLQIKLSNF